MYFVPLNQLESVELVIHALRSAGGEADCGTCPARQVCMKQCLTIAEAVAKMAAAGTLPALDESPDPAGEPPGEKPAEPAGEPAAGKSSQGDARRGLKVVK